jgi:prepilin-type N-terminal cleavage/methylation domain-containing protein/prepilin-type processing-associated H-X9-DG protein
MHPRKHHRGFTLVELLVVIGIIAALIGILLPVLSGVASRGRDIQCQSNLRTIVQLCMTYAAENKGQLPYGTYDAEAGPGVFEAWTNGNFPDTHKLVTLWSVLSRMSNKGYSGEDQFLSSSNPNNDPSKNTAPFLRCPEAIQVLPHVCSYSGSMTAFVSPSYDAAYRAEQPLVSKPTKTTQLLPFMGLVWDTAVMPGMQKDVGYVTGNDIDNQRIWIYGAANPDARYYTTRDAYGQTEPPNTAFGYGQNKLVNMGSGWKNIDPAPTDSDGFAGFPYQGNLRYRHNKNTVCNVGYGDGHVGQLTGKFDREGRILNAKFEAVRKTFQVKWPSGYGLVSTF